MNPDGLKNYQNILNVLKDKIRNARVGAVMFLNAHLLNVYWEIGQTISDQEKSEGWGSKIVDRLAADLKSEFPDMKGFSARNLRYMRNFSEAYPSFPNYYISVNSPLNRPLKISKDQSSSEDSILQAPLAKLNLPEINDLRLEQLSWYHHITLLDKVKDSKTRSFYILKAIEYGWSRDVMVHNIESGLHKRQGKILNNFSNTIAPPQSELVTQIFKSPYIFDFVSLEKEVKERDLESALISQITNFLLELGQWFAFMGRQYKIMLGKNEYFFDLLFYHTRLKRYIIIDLKIDEFKPEYSGKMDFYLNLADEFLKQQHDEKSIGLILCKTKDGLVAEYALRNLTNPIGITEYKINEKLPEEIKNDLPSIEDIENRMAERLSDLERPADKGLYDLKRLINKLKEEEIKEKANPENLNRILNDVVLPLKKALWELLSEVINWFENAEITIWLGHQQYSNDEEVKEKLNRSNMADSFQIKIELKCFKKAGSAHFDCIKSIYFILREYEYLITTSRNNDAVLLTKLYHQIPSTAELKNVVNGIYQSVIDELKHHLEKIINY